MSHGTFNPLAGAAALCALAGAVHAQVAPGIHELLPPPGPPVFNLTVTDVSADGRWAVGHCFLSGRIGVRWPLSGPNAFVAQYLNDVTGWTNITPTTVSADGTIVFGTGRPPGQTIGAGFKWTASGFSSLGGFGTPRDCSADGSLVLIDRDTSPGILMNATTTTVVRTLPPGFVPVGMNALGGLIVGGRYEFPYLAAREATGGGLEELCTLVGCGASNSYTRPTTGDLSDDGSTWAGVIRQVGTGYGGYDASLFFYRNGVLATVPNACGVHSEPELAAVSATGDVAVGTMFFCGPTSYTAFYYEPASGMRSLHEALTSRGVNLSGWDSLNIAYGMSANGSVVIGSGERTGPVYNVPFVAVVPLPCDPIDFNGDAIFPDVQDIADFLSVFAGGVCAGQQPGDTPCNIDIDFNNDSLFPDAADIGSFIRVFGGGSCG